MTEPTKLMGAEEFADLIVTAASNSTDDYVFSHGMGLFDPIQEAYDAALTALHEAVASDEESTRLLFVAADERDAALKRVAELEALVRHWEWANAEQDKREDALAAELSELRAASRAVLEPVHSTVTDEERLRKLLAQPQGARGKALLAVVAAICDYGEPWEHLGSGEIYAGGRGEDGYYLASVDGNGPLPYDEYADRIVAAVNALAGLQPAKLAALIEAAENRSYCDSMVGIGKRCGAPALCSGCQLKAALAELRGAAS